MEFYNVVNQKVQIDNNKNRNWFNHEFGIIDSRKSDFISELADAVNYEYQQELFREAEGAGKFTEWLESKELPADVVDTGKCYVLVFRKSRYYCRKDGTPILTDPLFKGRVIDAVEKVLYRAGEQDDKELKTVLWFLNKLGISVKVEKDTGW